MLRNIVAPPSFALIKCGKTSLLLKEGLKDLLLRAKIQDVEGFIKKNTKGLRYLSGRAAHPSILIDDRTRVVVRRYSHGGILRKLTRDLFLFGSRSFQEVAYTEAVRSCAIPTVEPVAAIHQNVFCPFYRAYLLSREVPNSKDLIQFFKEMIVHPSFPAKRKIIHSAALVLRKFHGAGFFHGDLQLKNILVADEGILLIDFDRSYRRKALSDGEKIANILRLNRSAEKWTRKGLPITWRDRFRFFSVYAGDDVEIRKAMRRAFRSWSLSNVIHQIGWRMERSRAKT
jgi:tRNA A-37 threonylcarbamoyl transferase component Bud32